MPKICQRKARIDEAPMEVSRDSYIKDIEDSESKKSDRLRKKRRETWFDIESMQDSRDEYRKRTEGKKDPLQMSKKERRDTIADLSEHMKSREDYKRNYKDSIIQRDLMGDMSDSDTWDVDFDENLDVDSMLQKQPSKPILKKNNLKQSRQVNTYKYQDSFKQIHFIIGGFSFSTYIHRLITHVEYMKTLLMEAMSNALVPQIDLEPRLFSTVQMTQDLFRKDLLPLISYTILNKAMHLKAYNNLLSTIILNNRLIAKYAFMGVEIVHFEQPIKYNIYSDEERTQFTYISQRSHDKEIKDVENILLFITATMFNIFVATNPYNVIHRLMEYFVEILSTKIDNNVKEHNKEFADQNND